jgi:hypothetical protein
MTTTEGFSAPAIVEPRYGLQPAPKVCASHNGHDLSEKLQPSITRITPRALRERELSALLHAAPAVVLDRDDRINMLIESTLDWLGLSDSARSRGHIPFDSNLFDLACNHQNGNMRVGDMFRFTPNLFGHIARKLLVYRSPGGDALQVFPNFFNSGGRCVPVPQLIFETAWDLMFNVLVGVLPEASRFAFAVEVDILVYPTSNSIVSAVQNLLADSSLLSELGSSTGFWSRLGRRLDASKARAAAVLKRRGARGLVAEALEELRAFRAKRSEKVSSARADTIPKDFHVIAPAHFDRTRYLTGLMGHRENLETQVLWDDTWISLPVTVDALAIFPSSKITTVSDIAPTRHRVLIHEPPGYVATASRNITVSLAIVSQERIAESSRRAMS